MRPVGRRPWKNLNLPRGMRARKRAGGKTYYLYDTGGTPRREIPLGSDYPLAVKKWAELEMARAPDAPKAAPITFREAVKRYMRDVLPTKADRTQRDNLREFGKLHEFFDNPPAPLDAITPQHVRQYLDRRKVSPTRANREKALLSHLFNCAREWGYTDRPNPCQGVKGFSERPRDVYVEDATLAAVWEAADWPLRDAIDLAYLTGQRPADVLAMRLSDVRDGALQVAQGKTGKRLRIAVEGELAGVIERIKARKYDVTSLSLVRNERGERLTYFALDSRFENARTAAAKKVEEALAAAVDDVEAQRLREAAAAIRAFQFRDLRAKAGTDKADSTDLHTAQRQLGHQNVRTTEIYVRARAGEKVKPTR